MGKIPSVNQPPQGERTPLVKETAPKESTAVEAKSSGKHLPLLTYDQSLRDVPWQTDNVHIQTGYRRHLSTVGLCLWSSIGCTSLAPFWLFGPSADSQTYTTKPVGTCLRKRELTSSQHPHALGRRRLLCLPHPPPPPSHALSLPRSVLAAPQDVVGRTRSLACSSNDRGQDRHDVLPPLRGSVPESE